MTIRSQFKAGGVVRNHNAVLHLRTVLKAGKLSANHSEPLHVRTAPKTGANWGNHNETLRRETDREAISMRRQVLTTVQKGDRLELLVIRTGLRGGVARNRFGGIRK